MVQGFACASLFLGGDLHELCLCGCERFDAEMASYDLVFASFVRLVGTGRVVKSLVL